MRANRDERASPRGAAARDKQHTPGPWEIGTATHGYEVCTVYGVTRQPSKDGLGQGWVYVYPPRVIDGQWHWPDEAEQFANARLIASAPDLLEALRDLLSDCREYVRINNLAGTDGQPATNHAMRRADAVIAKAEGT